MVKRPAPIVTLALVENEDSTMYIQFDTISLWLNPPIDFLHIIFKLCLYLSIKKQR